MCLYNRFVDTSVGYTEAPASRVNAVCATEVIMSVLCDYMTGIDVQGRMYAKSHPA